MIEANWLMGCFLAIYVGRSLAAAAVERLTIRHMKAFGSKVLPCFEGFVDPSTFDRITAYTAAKSHTGSIHGALSDVVLLAMLLFGFMPAVARTLLDRGLHFIPAGILFFMIPACVLYLLELPFDYYNSFKIEERFGFNRSTVRIWVADHVKSGLISLTLTSLLLALVLWAIRISPAHWPLWAFLAISCIQILLTVLYPVLIAPLFNKFEPLKDDELSGKIRDLMEENGIRIERIFQMDAGLRSRHTNAYFTGLGRTKRIVLYDTLLESHSHDEILSVLAHEAGHFKGRHIFKLVLLFELSLLAGLFITHHMLGWTNLYSTFGFASPEPYAGLFLIGIFWERAGYFLRPVYLGISRHFEREADSFAARLMKTSKPLVNSLKRMAADNLSNLAPHPLDVLMNYSHPPLVERIKLLERAEPRGGPDCPCRSSLLRRESETC